MIRYLEKELLIDSWFNTMTLLETGMGGGNRMKVI